MLTSSRALRLNGSSGKPLPYVEGLEGLYQFGMAPRHGQIIMIAGRSGSQKSGFVMWWVDQMDLPALYFSGDMSAFTASSRIASTRYGLPTEEIENLLGDPDSEQYADLMREVDGSKIQFSFGSPIRWEQIDEELTAYVELWNSYPEVLIFDNLMDFEGAESDYTAQMEVMQLLTELARETGCTVFIMHHASDKALDPKRPWKPPARNEIKGGMLEKPELGITVALNGETLDFNVAVVKQRMGPQDPPAERWITLRCEPELTRFHFRHFGSPSNN